MSVNKVILVGNLGGDPEVKATRSGNKYAQLSVATTKKWKDKAGERQEKTTWHRIIIWNKNLAEVAEKYFKKGTRVYVEGELDTREYEEDGKKRYVTEVLVNGFGHTVMGVSGYEGGGSGRPQVPDRDDDDFGDEIPFGSE